MLKHNKTIISVLSFLALPTVAQLLTGALQALAVIVGLLLVVALLALAGFGAFTGYKMFTAE